MRFANQFRTSVFVAALIAVALLLGGCAQLARLQRAAASSLSPPEKAMETAINNYRHAHGRTPLTIHPDLEAKARGMALWMVHGGCGRGGGGIPNICHSNLAGGIHVAWTFLGENVGMVAGLNNIAAMEGAFEHSPPHASTMLASQARFVGVGVQRWGNYTYVAEEFMAT